MLRAAGELDDLNYRIKRSTFTSGPPLLEAVNAKAVDLGGTGNTPPVFAAGSKSKIKVVGATHGSSDAEIIAVPDDSPLKKVSDLKGRSIAVAQGSSAHYQLITQLRKAGLSVGDVKISHLQPADALAAFHRGEVDAWAIWDPYTSQVLRSGKARAPSRPRWPAAKAPSRAHRSSGFFAVSGSRRYTARETRHRSDTYQGNQSGWPACLNHVPMYGAVPPNRATVSE